MYERFPEVTLSSLAEAGVRDESSIAVPKQRSHTHKMPIITSAQADTPCVDLGVVGLLERLNNALCASHSLNSAVYPILSSFIDKELDFGTAYAYLRPYWDGITIVECKLRTREEEGWKRRQNAVVDGKIVSGDMPPRRIWDVFANRVVPYWVQVDKYEHERDKPRHQCVGYSTYMGVCRRAGVSNDTYQCTRMACAPAKRLQH
ncbi:hypothetical protein ARMGADRAFT_1172230 [Armillaria gallica]|uniref:Uncharacterized protein n=1 Tax=Armillaria gallica TaxID=47427 RepID=A0A2H3CL09_ARMGA|nr:hypothetical protein ARMGADRAFT_1172230 [Armillaria gallica]